MNRPTIREEADGFFYVEEMVGGCYGKGDGSIGRGGALTYTRFQTNLEASYYLEIKSLRIRIETHRETINELLNWIGTLTARNGRVYLGSVRRLVKMAARISKQVAQAYPPSPSTDSA